MAAPGIAKSISSLHGSPWMEVANWGLLGGMGMYGWKERVKNGENPVSAAGREMLSQAPWLLMSNAGANFYMFAPSVARFATTAIIGAVNHQTAYNRQIRTPFSHRFEHTAVTAQMQMAGMQAIGNSWGGRHTGSEAAAMAARYGRR